MTDHSILRGDAYVDSSKLTARASLYDFKVPQFSFWDWCLDQTDWPTGARVLDVGCGPGHYLRALARRQPSLRLVGADLSDGMAAEAAVNVVAAAALVADAQHLPFATGSFDRVLAMHMLYHCADIDRAVAELRRVLRPGGVALVVTNGRRHLDTFRSLMASATGAGHWLPVAERFVLEDAPDVLSRQFESVTVHQKAAEVVVPEAAPVIAYAASARAFAEPNLVGVTWDEAMVRFAAAVDRMLAEQGEFRAVVDAGVVVCR